MIVILSVLYKIGILNHVKNFLKKSNFHNISISKLREKIHRTFLKKFNNNITSKGLTGQF